MLLARDKDGDIRLWRFEPLAGADILTLEPIVLRHKVPEEHPDVTSVVWDPAGTILASGSFDGMVRIWTVNGDLYMSQQQHSVILAALSSILHC